MDQKDAIACCQTAESSVLETDAEVFDCDTCPMALAREALWDENREAWTIFTILARRVVVDLGVADIVFANCVKDRPAEDVLDLVDRLALMYDIVQPPKETGS